MKSMRALLGFLVLHIGLAPAPAATKPLKVFILAGQSNMEGQAVTDLEGKDYNGGKGTLAALMRDPAKNAMFKHLQDAQGKWTVRDDVWVRYQRERGPLLAGALGLGFSVYGDQHHFGPELQFGHVVGDHFENQVLLIKTAWGGKSLYRDFRPPSSGGEVGAYYTKMLAEIRTALTNLKADFPDYDGGGYELTGFVWYQGWNDGVNPKTAVPEYETNLVNLIKDVRAELNAPKLPVVIGELTGPWIEAPAEWTRLRKAQAAAAARPEFAGNVVFVPTHEFVRKAEDSPNPSHGHHEFGNAETYFLVGDALGKGMLSLLRGRSGASHQTNFIEGWTVLVNDQLLAQDRAATTKALELLRGQLQEIVRVVPASALAKVREVTLWFSPEYPGVKPRAEYHPGAGWLRDNGRDPMMAKGVEFTDVRHFEAETRRMPNFTLHELAHAYHDRVLARGFENVEINAAYERAKAGKTYDKVERWFGSGRSNTFERAYAMTSPMEYFAETTEAFFSRNDFFPFTRTELKQHDPEMYDLLARLWGLQAKPAEPKRKTAAAYQQAPVDFNHPPRDYITNQLRGWDVVVEKQLVDEEPELATATLARLDKKLGEAVAVLPANTLPALRRVRIFLMYGPKAKVGGRNNGLEYFGARAARHQAWLDPRMARSIVIFNAANYAQLSEFWALKSLVHEFGHAQHLEHWPESRADIFDTWEQAMKDGLYQTVREEDKGSSNPNYAAQNHLEYFAELTAMYFVGCNYFPKDRAELKAYDLKGHALIEKLWGVNGARATAASETK